MAPVRAPAPEPQSTPDPALLEKLRGIVLEDPQVRTLELLVEASRVFPPERRQPVYGKRKYSTASADLLLMHPGIPGNHTGVYPGDVRQLADERLIRLNDSGATWEIEVTGLGYACYAWQKERQGGPIERLERSERSYLDIATVAERHPVAVARWREAERLLWSADSSDTATTIGHLCREAHQAFASSMLDRHPNPAAPPDRLMTKARLAAALDALSIKSDRLLNLASALLQYWGAVVDLAQRQEHGANREGETLTWEDSRRLVFATLFALTEMDRLT